MFIDDGYSTRKKILSTETNLRGIITTIRNTIRLNQWLLNIILKNNVTEITTYRRLLGQCQRTTHRAMCLSFQIDRCEYSHIISVLK